MLRAPALALVALAVALAAALLGCAPAIGDRCTLSTDCSAQGTRFCDTSQTGGYCTLLHCTADKCPENAACVQFGASIAGCAYDDYRAPSPTGRAMCMKTCASDSDCRQSDGYACVSPTNSKTVPEHSTVILDTNTSKTVCMLVRSVAPIVSDDAGEPAVCSASRPDASPLDATLSPKSGGEGGPNANEASSDASEEPSGDSAALEAEVDATEEDAAEGGPLVAAADASGEGAGDSGTAEAGDASGQDARDGGPSDGPADALGDVLTGGSLDALVDSGALDAPGGG